MTYILTREGVLRVIFEATTDKQTPVNMVQHSYFNLAGHAAGHSLDRSCISMGTVLSFLWHAYLSALYSLPWSDL